VPTLAWQRGGTFLDQRDLKHDRSINMFLGYWRDVTWKRFTDEMMPGCLHDPLSWRKEYFAANLQMVAAMHRAGVPFWLEPTPHPASTSCPDSASTMSWPISSKPDSHPWNRCKLRPAPSKFLGLENNYGSVQAGKIADLVLLTPTRSTTFTIQRRLPQ